MMNTLTRVLSLAITLTAALLVGCGGGGGAGGGSSSVLTVVTDWTNHLSPGGGLSEQLDLRDKNGLLVQELNVNQDAAGVLTRAFASVSPGVYHLTGQLWSQRDLGGVQVGVFDTFVTLTSSTSVHIDIGNNPNSVSVTPASATIVAQHSQQFFAAVLDSTGNIVFTPAGSIAWSGLGGVVTIDAVTGIATATNAGSGSVRATYTPGGLPFGGAVVDVTPFTITNSKWTVLIYMNAANDLDAFSTQNMIQMQKVAGVPANVRFVVEWKQAAVAGQTPTFIGTRRYLVTPSSSNQMVSQVLQDLGTGVDMGNAQTMADFVNWGKTYFPATRYCVIVWNHGNGWAPGRARRIHDMPTRGFSYDDDSGNHIDTWQLGQSLGTVQPDILAWDASLMQMLEVAYEARNQARFVVGSEESPPAAGYPYDTIFANFRDNPDDTTLNLSKTFVDGMMTAYGGQGTPITQSVIDTTQLPALATSTSSLADALIANKASLTNLVPFVRNTAEKYDDFGPPLNRLYRDLYDVCSILQNGGGGNPPAPSPVITAAQNLQAAIVTAVPYQRHSVQSPNSHGVSIDFSQSADFLANKYTDYQQLSFGSDSNLHWMSWLTQAP